MPFFVNFAYMMNQYTQVFILQHRNEDVRKLALSAVRNPSVDLPFALDQIQGWQTARFKLPAWAAIEGIVYPPRLSMEQCSSEPTAAYKQRLAARLAAPMQGESTLIDLTGGFGVDFSFMSRGFRRAIYVEQNERLCDIARHNFALLGMTHAEVVCGDGAAWLHRYPIPVASSSPAIVYLDPARRDGHGQKVFGLHDCTPDVTLLRDELLSKAHAVIIKLSPMLDWHAAIAALGGQGRGAEVHIVSVANECKELLIVLTHRDMPLKVVCTNDGDTFSYTPADTDFAEHSASVPAIAGEIAGTLLVPGAAIMKAGCFDEVSARFSVPSLDDNSHLFVSPHPVDGFPGRQFRILSVSTMNKKELKAALGTISQANIAVRNFPLSVSELRRRLKLKDGGTHYIFATTWQGRHVLIITVK